MGELIKLMKTELYPGHEIMLMYSPSSGFEASIFGNRILRRRNFSTIFYAHSNPIIAIKKAIEDHERMVTKYEEAQRRYKQRIDREIAQSRKDNEYAK